MLTFSSSGQIALNEDLSVPDKEPSGRAVYLGQLDEVPCFVERSDAESPQGLEYRSLFSQIPDVLYSLIGYASQILTWSENHRFCSRCGTRAEPSDHDRAMVCPECGLMNFPRISPSIIVAVSRGDELLMCRGHHFPEELYSVVAGFVEPGETLEECVAREVLEETGIEVTNIKYHSSQPWPFPHSLMIGFAADYARGDIRIDPKEIEDAGWYTRSRLPARIPSKSTIARTLIDHYLSKPA